MEQVNNAKKILMGVAVASAVTVGATNLANADTVTVDDGLTTTVAPSETVDNGTAELHEFNENKVEEKHDETTPVEDGTEATTTEETNTNVETPKEEEKQEDKAEETTTTNDKPLTIDEVKPEDKGTDGKLIYEATTPIETPKGGEAPVVPQGKQVLPSVNKAIQNYNNVLKKHNYDANNDEVKKAKKAVEDAVEYQKLAETGIDTNLGAWLATAVAGMLAVVFGIFKLKKTKQQ